MERYSDGTLLFLHSNFFKLMRCIARNDFELETIRDYYLDTSKTQQVILVQYKNGGREIKFLFDDGKNRCDNPPLVLFQGSYFYRVIYSLTKGDPDEDDLIKYIELDLKGVDEEDMINNNQSACVS